MNWKTLVVVFALALVSILGSNAVVAHEGPHAELLVSGLEGGSGSTIGPGGDLYVTEGAAGRITRVDPRTGQTTTYAEGLPTALLPIGGAIDVAFLDGTAYVLVTLVGEDLGGTNTVGIYRMEGPDSFSVFADVGTFALDNPPNTSFFIPTGVQYALQTFRGGFLVTDGHHNRMLHVNGDGEVTELIAFDNIVPTGIAVSGNTIYMAEAGPNPHLPENGKIVALAPNDPTATEVASGARLLVDVEFGRGRTLYGLAQGIFPEGADDGSPALPNTGSLVRANGNGSFSTITSGLNQPTSLEMIGNTAYVITLGGEIWTIEGVSEPPYGLAH